MQSGCELILELDAKARCLHAWALEPSLLFHQPGQLAWRTIDEVLGPMVGVSFVDVVKRVHETGAVEHVEYPVDLPCGRRWFFADVKRAAPDRVMFFARRLTVTHRVRWDWDLVSNTVTWNAGVSCVLGYDHVDGSATWWKDRLHPEDRAGVLKRLGAMLASRRRGWNDRYRFRRGDGSYVEMLETALVHRDGGGCAARLAGAMTEIAAKLHVIASTCRGVGVG
jgi:PAS domain-containing protein